MLEDFTDDIKAVVYNIIVFIELEAILNFPQQNMCTVSKCNG